MKRFSLALLCIATLLQAQSIQLVLDPGPTQVGQAAQTLAGTIDPMDAALVVNGASLSVDAQGHFSYPVTLHSGLNSFLFRASKPGFADGVAKRDMVLDTVPPQVVFTSPQADFHTHATSLTIAAIVDDTYDDAPSLSRDGTPIPVNDRRFIDANLALTPGANNFTYTATDAAGNSQTFTLTVYQRSTPPTLTLTAPDVVTAGSPYSVHVAFSPAADIASTRTKIDAVTLSETTDGADIHLDLTQVGTLSNIQVAVSATDIYGNSASAFHTIQVARPHYLFGLVLDDQTSKPLAGIPVIIHAPTGDQTVVTDLNGAYQAYAYGQPLLVSVEQSTYLSTWRKLDALGDGERVPNLRLIARNAALSGGVHDLGKFVVTLGGFSGQASVTKLSAQGLPALLPLGYSPVLGFELANTSGTGTVHLEARSLGALPGQSTLWLLKQDGSDWWVQSQTTVPAQALSTTFSASNGTYVYVLADPWSTASTPQPGQHLERLGDRLIDAAMLDHLSTYPTSVSLLDNPRTSVSLRVAGAGRLPSGSRAQILCRERHERYSENLLLPAYALDVYTYAYGANDASKSLLANFYVSAREQIDPALTRYASINFEARQGERFEPNFPDAQNRLDLGALTLDFSGVLQPGRVARLMTAEATPPLSAISNSVFSFELWLSEALSDAPKIDFSGPTGQHLILLHQLEDQTWVYAGQLTQTSGRWSAPAGTCALYQAGVYAFVSLDYAITDLSGQVTYGGSPVADARIKSAYHPWFGISDPSGAYRFLVRQNGNQVIEAQHAATHRSASITLSNLQAVANRTGIDFTLSASPFSLLYSEPANGQQFVARSPQITLSFDQSPSIDRDHLASQITLESALEQVPLQILPDPEALSLHLLPLAALLPDTDYTLTLQPGLENLWGQTLGQSATVQFHTLNQSSTESPDLSQFYLVWENQQLQLRAPAGALPSRTFLQVRSSERGFSWSGTWLTGAFDLDVVGEVGEAIDLEATAPNGRTYKHRVTLTRLEQDVYLLGSSPFHLELGPDLALDVDRITSGFGSVVRIERVANETLLTSLASAPVMASAPEHLAIAAVRFSLEEGQALPELLGRLTVPMPEGNALQGVTLLEVQEHVSVPTSLEDPTLVEQTFAYVHDFVPVRAGSRVELKGKIGKSTAQALKLSFSLDADQTAQFGAFRFETAQAKTAGESFVKATVLSFRQDADKPTEDGEELSGVTVFAPSNDHFVPVGVTKKGRGQFFWYGPLGPIKCIDPSTFANKNARLADNLKIETLTGEYLADSLKAIVSFPPLKPDSEEYDPQIELEIEVGVLKDGAFERDQALMDVLKENHALEVSDNPLRRVRLVATSKNSAEEFKAELSTTFNGSAVIKGKAEGPNRLIFDLPNISGSPGFHRFTVFIPDRATPLGQVSTSLLIEDSSNPGQDVAGHPEVVFWEPAHNSKDVAVVPRIYLRFSEPVKQLKSAITFTQGEDEVTFEVIGLSGRPITDDTFAKEALILPNAALRFKTAYTLTIEGAVDQGGLALQFKGEDAPFKTSFKTRAFPDPEALERDDAGMATASIRNLLLTLKGENGKAGFQLTLYDLRDPDAPKKIYNTTKALGSLPSTIYQMCIFPPDVLKPDDGAWAKPSTESQPLDRLPEGTVIAIAGHFYDQDVRRIILVKWSGDAFQLLAQFPLYQAGILRAADQMGPYFLLSFRDMFHGNGATVGYDLRKHLELIKEGVKNKTLSQALSELPPNVTYPLPSNPWDITPFLRKDEMAYKPTLVMGGEEFPGLLSFEPKKRPYFVDDAGRDGRELAKLDWPSGDWLSKDRVGRWNNYSGVAEQLRYHKNNLLVSEDFALYAESDRAASGKGYIYVFAVPQGQESAKDAPQARLTLVLPDGLKNMAVDRSSGLIAIQDHQQLLNVLDLKTLLEHTTPGEVLTLEFPNAYFLLDKPISTTYSLQMKFYDGWLIGVEFDVNEQVIRPIPINPRRYRTQGFEYIDLEDASYAQQDVVDTHIRYTKQMVLYASDWDLDDQQSGFNMEMGSYVVDLFSGEKLTLELLDAEGQAIGEEEIRKANGFNRQTFSLVDLATYFQDAAHRAQLRKKGFEVFSIKITVEKDETPILDDTVNFVVAYLPDLARRSDPHRQVAELDSLSQRPVFHEVDLTFSSRDSRMSLDIDRHYADLYSWQVNPYGPGMADAAQLQMGLPVFWRTDQFGAVPKGKDANPLLLFDLPGEFQYFFTKKASAWKCIGDLQAKFKKDESDYSLNDRHEVAFKLIDYKELDYRKLFDGFNRGLSSDDDRRKLHYPLMRYTRAGNVPYALLSGARTEHSDLPWENKLRFLFDDKPSSVPEYVMESVKDSGQNRKVKRSYSATEVGTLIESQDTEPGATHLRYLYDQQGYLMEVTRNGHFPRTYTWEEFPEVPKLGDFVPKRLIRVAQGNWFRGYSYDDEMPTRVAALESPYGTQAVTSTFDGSGRLESFTLEGIETPTWKVKYADNDGAWLCTHYGPATNAAKTDGYALTYTHLDTEDGKLSMIETDSFGAHRFEYDDEGRLIDHAQHDVSETWQYNNEDDFFNLPTRYTEPSTETGKTGNAMIYEVSQEGLSIYPENDPEVEDYPQSKSGEYLVFNTPLSQIIGEPVEPANGMRSKTGEGASPSAITLNFSKSGTVKSRSLHGRPAIGGKDSENYVPSEGDLVVEDDRLVQRNYPGTENPLVENKYDDIGNLIEVKKAGVVQQFSDFDDLGRPLTVSFPEQSGLDYTMEYTYNEGRFQVTRTETLSGNTETTAYDALGRMVEQSRNWMGTEGDYLFTYDALNRLTHVVNDATTVYQAEYFDDTNFPSREVFPEHSVEYTAVLDSYIPTYLSAAITDTTTGIRRERNFKTDIHGRSIEGEEPGLGHVGYEYDAWGRLIRILDPQSREVFRTIDYPNKQNTTVIKDEAQQIAYISSIKDELGLKQVSGYFAEGQNLPMVEQTTKTETAAGADLFTTTAKAQGELEQVLTMSALGYLKKLSANGLTTEAQTYDNRGRPTAYSGDFKSKYTYADNGRLTDFTSPEGYAFNDLQTNNGRLSNWTSPREQSVAINYINPEGSSAESVVVDDVTLFRRNGASTTHTSPLGSEATLGTSVTDNKDIQEWDVPEIGNATSGQATTVWDTSSGLLQSHVDLNGVPTELKYDRLGRLSGQMVIGGVDYEITPPATGANKTDANDVWTLTPTGGVSTKIQLDPLGQLKSYSYGETKTKIERDLDQRITEIEDGRTGRTLKLNYLNQTNLLDKIEGLEEEISFSDYDRGSPKKTVVGPEDKPLVKREVTYHPDHPGVAKTIKETYPGGLIDTREFNTFGQLIKVEAPYQEPVTYTYNKWGMPSKMTQGEDGVEISLFDDRNNLTWNLDPAVTLTIDPAGRLQTVAMASLAPISYYYDAGGRITSVKYADTSQYDYTYADNLLQTLTTDGQEQRTYSYDSNQRLTQINDNLRSTPLASYTYSSEDRLETYTDGNDVVTTYAYDKHGHVKKLDITDGPSLAYGYHENGDLKSVSSGSLSARFDDYDRGTPGSWKWVYSGSEVASFTATLDEGRIESIAGNDFLLELNWSEMTPGSPMITNIKKAGPGYGEDWDVSYTEEHKLAGIVITRSNGDVITENYAVSPKGLPTKLKRSQASTTLIDLDLYQAASEVRNDLVGNSQTLYDNRGSLVSLTGPGAQGRLENYDFNGHRQLSHFELKRQGPNPFKNFLYDYDQDGRRIASTDNQTLNNTAYAWQGSRVIAIGLIQGLSVHWTHVIGYGPLGPVFIEDLVGDNDYFIFTDHLGTPFAYKNAITNKVYYTPTNPWGELLAQTASQPSPFEDGNLDIPTVTAEPSEIEPNPQPVPVFELPPDQVFGLPPLGLAGHLRDATTGLIHMHHRIFHPRLGHFLTPDFRAPDIYDPTTFTEPYAYAAGNPIMFYDPDGRAVEYIGNGRVKIEARDIYGVLQTLYMPQADWIKLVTGQAAGYGPYSQAMGGTNPESMFRLRYGVPDLNTEAGRAEYKARANAVLENFFGPGTEITKGAGEITKDIAVVVVNGSLLAVGGANAWWNLGSKAFLGLAGSGAAADLGHQFAVEGRSVDELDIFRAAKTGTMTAIGGQFLGAGWSSSNIWVSGGTKAIGLIGSGYGVYEGGSIAYQGYQEGNYLKATYGVAGTALSGFGFYKSASALYYSPNRTLSGLPQGVTQEQFDELAVALRKQGLDYAVDVRAHGSRVSRTARPNSDLDIAIRVNREQFNVLIDQSFGNVNLGSARMRTMMHAIWEGKITTGDAGLRSLKKELRGILGRDVDISIIRQGGNFDQGPWIILLQ